MTMVMPHLQSEADERVLSKEMILVLGALYQHKGDRSTFNCPINITQELLRGRNPLLDDCTSGSIARSLY
jgi:hypothetical protein